MTTTTPAPPSVPAPVDPATEPFLQGVFAPTRAEHDDVGLAIEGELPAGLTGAYLRNGMNAIFPPLGSYTYPIDGDGMVHGLWIDGTGPPGTATGSSRRRSLRAEQPPAAPSGPAR